MRRGHIFTGGSLLVLAIGCTAMIDDPNSDGSSGATDRPGAAGAASCGTGDDAPYVPLARLTRFELERTLGAVLPAGVLDAVAGPLAQVPREGSAGAGDGTQRDITEAHVRGYAGLADAIGEHVAADPAARGQLSSCLAETIDDACLGVAITEWGAQLWRRPVDAAERDALVGLFRTIAVSYEEEAGLHAVVSSMLQAPEALFRVELGPPGEPPGAITLTDHELVARLAYVLWGAPPDDELTAAADAGALDDAELAAQADRMLADPRAREQLAHHVRQWLVLDRDFGIDAPPDHIREALATDGLGAAAADELDQLTAHLIWEEGAGVAELFTTRLSFVGHPALAEIYGVGAGGTATPVELPAERAGLLARVAFLADSQGIEHPILRGRRIREQLLCGELYRPDPDSLPEGALEDPPFDPTATTRERFARATAAPECASCHTQINPLGFALSSFDGLGRARDRERIFDADGSEIAQVPVDDTVVPAIERADEPEVSGAAGLGAAIAGHPRAHACAATRWLQQQLGREAIEADRCAVEQLSAEVAPGGGGFVEMMRTHVTETAFRRRRVTP